MPSHLSVNLREHVVAAVLAGASSHRAASRLGVSVLSAGCSTERFRYEGHLASKPMHGDDSLPELGAHADLIHALDQAQPELFLRALSDALGVWSRDEV